ncbi:MAG: hypothetical protein H7Z17_15610 [Fuerstia sp.]|nr:hypothetical protein [Fuerstiella sp.]
MYFRFAAGLMLVVLVSMAGVWLEKQTLEMRRTVSVQYYQTDVLLDILVRLRLETQQLTAPAQLAVAQAAEQSQSKQQPKTESRRSRVTHRRDEPSKSTGEGLPLLRFQHPFNPEGID